MLSDAAEKHWLFQHIHPSIYKINMVMMLTNDIPIIRYKVLFLY